VGLSCGGIRVGGGEGRREIEDAGWWKGGDEFMTMLRLVVMMGSAMLAGSADGITPKR
jgi:hypothetical protein